MEHATGYFLSSTCSLDPLHSATLASESSVPRSPRMSFSLPNPRVPPLSFCCLWHSQSLSSGPAPPWLCPCLVLLLPFRLHIQSLHFGKKHSTLPTTISFDVPQGQVFEPLFFFLSLSPPLILSLSNLNAVVPNHKSMGMDILTDFSQMWIWKVKSLYTDCTIRILDLQNYGSVIWTLMDMPGFSTNSI